MTWSVVLHPLVLEEDLPRLPKPARRQILDAVERRLGTDPESYGSPLRKELWGFWKMRVGDYRVIYSILEKDILVLIVKIGMRRDREVYAEMIGRLRKLR